MEQNTKTNISSSNGNADNVIKYGRTQPQFNDFTYMWAIENVTMFTPTIMYRSDKFSVTSPTFIVYNGDDKFEFQIKFHPGRDFILCLHRISSPTEENHVWIELSLVNSVGKEFKGSKILMKIDTSSEDSLLYTLYLPVSTIREYLVSNDELRIKCLIQFLKGVTHNELPENPDASAGMSRLSLLNDFEALFKSMKFSDIKLVVKDGQEFPAHKSVLATRSRVFAAMLERDMKESKSNVIKIPEVEPEILAEMLRFIYTGRVNDIEKLAVDLIDVANMYQLETLKFMCEMAIIAKLSLENLAECLTLVDMYNEAYMLRKSVMQFLKLHKAEIVKMENFDAVLKKLSSTLVHEIKKVVKY